MNSIHTIDCKYIYDEFACAYLIREGNEVAFLDNNTNSAIPILLKKLEEFNFKKEDVRYLIITHIHLDHAGASSQLIRLFPNAKILAHPKATPHLINPKRIIESASQVYGKENFLKLYGEILDIPEDRIISMKDGEVLNWGEREFKFIYTRGHANHHFVIHDSKTNHIFTGDSFGISYPKMKNGKSSILIPSTTPTDFDPEEALLSLDKILNSGASAAYLTHYDKWLDMKLGYELMQKGIQKMAWIQNQIIDSNNEDSEIEKFCKLEIESYYKSLLKENNLDLDIIHFLKDDIDINTMGILFSANRLKRKKKV
jgi:glyoxylase-like metal-dependent hydrolase (beta-lactamase superfamily II)